MQFKSFQTIRSFSSQPHPAKTLGALRFNNFFNKPCAPCGSKNKGLILRRILFSKNTILPLFRIFVSMDKPIIFYDGDCGFCNKTVQFVLNHEKNSEIHFCALQSDFAKAFFEKLGIHEIDLSTFYFWDGKKLHSRSTAALKVLNYLRFPYTLGKIGWICPGFIRDYIYNQIAKRRMRLVPSFCALPTPSQAVRFLSQKTI